MTEKTKKTAVAVVFLLYGATMLYFMIFGRIGTVHYGSYTEYLKNHVMLVPLQFIPDYINSVPEYGIYNYRLRNIIGNTVLFAPLGVFLPYLFKCLGRYVRMILAVALIIFVLELIQLFTALGTFDIDDVLLNCIGASVGFFLYKRLVRQ